MRTFRIKAHRDSDAGVWWAESDDLPGLVAEAATHDDLVDDIRQIVPDLLALNLPEAKESTVTLVIVSDQVEELTYA